MGAGRRRRGARGVVRRARAGGRRRGETGPVMGRAVVLGDDINTDLIIAGKHCGLSDPRELGRRLFEGTGLEGRIRGGEVVVAGRNMGMGSSREQAPVALMAAGVRGVAAESFGRIFFRNAINIGLPVMRVPGLRGRVREGQRVSLDVAGGALRNLTTGEVVKGEPLPPFLMEILGDRGLVPHIRKRLAGRRAGGRAGAGQRRPQTPGRRGGGAGGGGAAGEEESAREASHRESGGG
ncbi:MAG: LeuD/DmdB family oxidoreductase small subunit [Thermoplasmatota archaeon]